MVESDEEQLEVLKRWWDENGTSLLGTIVLSLAAIFGYQAWQNNIQQTGEAASGLYEDLVQATTMAATADENEAMLTTASSLGTSLKDEYGDTTYAVFAAMHLARLAAEQGDLETAQAELDWALDAATEPHLETIVRMRLARVLVARKDPTAAMALLINHQPAPGQVSSFEEVKGDVYHALGDMTNARQAYQLALEHVEDDRPKPVLELKLADIPVASTVSEPAATDESGEDDA